MLDKLKEVFVVLHFPLEHNNDERILTVYEDFDSAAEWCRNVTEKNPPIRLVKFIRGEEFSLLNKLYKSTCHNASTFISDDKDFCSICNKECAIKRMVK
jgi:hypothetical protein